jgi:hypothetical protein
MYTYRYVQLSIILMMSGSVLQAALTSAEPTRFKTEADIHLGVKLAALGAGFTAGVAEQTAAFASFVSLMDNTEYTVLPCALYTAHWVGSFKLAFHMMASSQKKIEELQNSERSFVPVMIKMGFDRIYKPHELEAFRDSYLQLYRGEQAAPRLDGSQLDASSVCDAYNALLQQQVTKLHFWGGVLAVATVGPISGASGTVALYKLGVLDPSTKLD